MAVRLLTEVLPKFADEIRSLMIQRGLPHLADQVDGLSIVDICSCGQRNCATFYTAPKPDDGYGEGHENIGLDSDTGLLVLDVVDEKIVQVEVLDRRGLRDKIIASLAS